MNKVSSTILSNIKNIKKRAKEKISKRIGQRNIVKAREIFTKENVRMFFLWKFIIFFIFFLRIC